MSNKSPTYNNAETKVMKRLPNRMTAQPANGSAISEPIGSMNKTAPNCASLKPNCSLIAGMRAAQVANVHPQQKKNADIAMR